jgi:hypothetical protein
VSGAFSALQMPSLLRREQMRMPPQSRERERLSGELEVGRASLALRQSRSTWEPIKTSGCGMTVSPPPVARFAFDLLTGLELSCQQPACLLMGLQMQGSG